MHYLELGSTNTTTLIATYKVEDSVMQKVPLTEAIGNLADNTASLTSPDIVDSLNLPFFKRECP